MTVPAHRGASDVHEATCKAYLDRFATMRAELPGAGLPWLDAWRASAIERFAEHGFPGPRLEEWRFTNLSKLAETVFEPFPSAANGISREDLGGYRLEDASDHLLVFVNGRLRPDLSDTGALGDGVTVTGLSRALEDDAEAVEESLIGADDPPGDKRASSLGQLNAAFMGDGAVIRVAANAQPDRPVHLLFLAHPNKEPVGIHPRNLIHAGEGAKLTVIESYVGLADGPYWTNAVTHVTAEKGAAIQHFKFQAEGAGAFHIAVTDVDLHQDASYTNFVMSLGGILARNEIRARYTGEGVHCALKGVSLARGRQHVDTTTSVDHLMASGVTDETYKGIVDDRARSVFRGKIRVAPGAQKTNAYQLNQNLLLSDRAQADSKPELEIFADDVKCGHGSTVGDIDAEALFYLRARGLEERDARTLLIEAFLGQLIDDIEIAPVRAMARKAFTGWLAGLGG
ncbi:MAG: Fe-S cluster assembly protein SufD [Proteobacteria bacterium]|nr:Fe-S cluster assembly protein SufD [Pseudomonadota bacterium]